jgi:hypothetical protein
LESELDLFGRAVKDISDFPDPALVQHRRDGNSTSGHRICHVSVNPVIVQETECDSCLLELPYNGAVFSVGSAAKGSYWRVQLAQGLSQLLCGAFSYISQSWRLDHS